MSEIFPDLRCFWTPKLDKKAHFYQTDRISVHFYLPLSNFLEAGEHFSEVFVCAVRVSRDSLHHPIPEFRVQLDLFNLWVLIGQLSLILIELLN